MQSLLVAILFLQGTLVTSMTLNSAKFRPLGRDLSMKHETIVVTGLGVISSVGVKPVAYFDNLVNGVSGITNVDRFDASPFKCQIAGQVKNFDPKAYYQSKKKIKQNDLSCHYAVAASHEALADAGLVIDAAKGIDATRIGVIIGSAFGGMETFERASLDLAKLGPNAVGPYTIPMILGNTAAGVVAMETGAKGPNFGVQTACATATHAFGEVCICACMCAYMYIFKPFFYLSYLNSMIFPRITSILGYSINAQRRRGRDDRGRVRGSADAAQLRGLLQPDGYEHKLQRQPHESFSPV